MATCSYSTVVPTITALTGASNACVPTTWIWRGSVAVTVAMAGTVDLAERRSRLGVTTSLTHAGIVNSHYNGVSRYVPLLFPSLDFDG